MIIHKEVLHVLIVDLIQAAKNKHRSLKKDKPEPEVISGIVEFHMNNEELGKAFGDMGVITRFVIDSDTTITEVNQFAEEEPVAAELYASGYCYVKGNDRQLKHIVRDMVYQRLCIEVHESLRYGI